MSPPPRLEAEDYWNSRSSHGHKKKHRSRGAGTLRTSHSGKSTEKLQSSTIEQYDKDFHPLATGSRAEADDNGGQRAPQGMKPSNAVDTTDEQHESPPYVSEITPESHDQPKYHKLPVSVPQEKSLASPAVSSLKRLSVAEANNSGNISQSGEVTKRSFGRAIKSLLPSSDTTSPPSELPDEVFATSTSNARRRSSAFRGRDSQRLKNEDTKTPSFGLSIPASIMLRKATGLLGLGVSTKPSVDVGPEEPPSTEESPLNSPTAFTIVSFDSRHIGDKAHITRYQADSPLRRRSTISIAGQEAIVNTSFTNTREMVDSRRSSLAGPVVTFTNTFPSTAIMTSPTSSFPSINGPDHRFSVVQIKSQNSLHQVIWREDDTPSDSGTSSEHPSPTDSLTALNTSENSPTNKPSTASKNGTRQSSKVSLCKDDDMGPDPLVKMGAGSLPKLSKPRSDGHMLQWSWGTDRNGLEDPENTNNGALQPHSTSSPFGPPLVPQLFFPTDEEKTPLKHHELGLTRRGSFMVDAPPATSLAAGRELGSRRSISVQPFMLSNLSGLGVAEDRGKDSMSRRLSRIS